MQSYILGKSGKLNKSAQETATTGFSKFHSSLSMQISICICWGVQKPLGVYKNSIWLALFWLCKALVSQCTTGSVHRPTERQLWVYKAPTLLTKILIFLFCWTFCESFCHEYLNRWLIIYRNPIPLIIMTSLDLRDFCFFIEFSASDYSQWMVYF